MPATNHLPPTPWPLLLSIAYLNHPPIPAILPTHASLLFEAGVVVAIPICILPLVRRKMGTFLGPGDTGCSAGKSERELSEHLPLGMNGANFLRSFGSLCRLGIQHRDAQESGSIST